MTKDELTQESVNEDTCSSGLTKREWFAGMALIGLIAQSQPPALDHASTDDFAAWSFEMADAMLDWAE